TIGTPGTEDESVELKIPAGTASNMVEGVYDAEITWTIEAAP
ncbi:WxL domain-containing protein, partial [Vagococcus sp. BWB3-3]|nr:WxL domain-containing protein [Vagococcus allomyrinae]